MTVMERLRSMSTSDFAALGIEHVAYVVPVTLDGVVAYAVHSADGQRLEIAPSRARALVLIRENDLEPVTVH